METINRLTNVLVTMNNPTDRGKLFKIIKLLYPVLLYVILEHLHQQPPRVRTGKNCRTGQKGIC